MENYSKNYIKIYFWRIISILSGFLSMLIVVPHLSNKPVLYGVYAFCISFTLYLTYADIGFLTSGQKYAAEAFAKGNKEEEINVLGFIGAVLLLMILPFSGIMIYFSFYPELIMSGLNLETAKVSKYIFLILGIGTPLTIVLQRLIQSILVIRIKDYISQRVDVVANLIKIFSVFFFFNDKRYLLVEYFIFITLVTFLANIITLMIIRKYEDYNFPKLFRSIRLKKIYFNKLKKLAYSSIFLTIGWLLYYELDLIFIGKFMTPLDVAYYSVGFTFLNFLRTLYNAIYAPFYHRFNHFIALEEAKSIKKMLTNLVELTMPICLIASLLIVLSSKFFVIFWVGPTYEPSILILAILVIGTLFNFISIPGNYYTMAKEKHEYLYIVSILLPLVFGLGILILFNKYGILSFAISKSLAFVFGSIVYSFSIRKLVKIEEVIWKWKTQIILSVSSILWFFPKLLDVLFLELEKSTAKLLILAATTFLIFIIYFSFFVLSKKSYRNMVFIKAKLLFK